MAKAKQQELSIEEKLEQALIPEDEQPYEVPNNWAWTILGSLCDNVQYGYTAKSSIDNVGPKLLRITDIQYDFVDWANVPFCEISQEDYEKFKIRINDIVIARTGATTGKSYLITENAESVFASYLIRVKLKEELNHKFLYYFMRSDYYWKQITELAQGIAQPGVNATKLQTMKYPLPPITEQKRIVERIESLFEKLDNAKELAQNALDTFETRKAAILHKAFTGELTAKWRQKNGVGMDSWKKTTLKEHTSLLGDGIHGTPKYTDEGEYYFINGNNFNRFSILLKNDTKRVSKEEYEKYKKNLTSRTVFVSINGTLGKTAFYNNEPVILGKSACYFNVKAELDKHFIRYYLETKEFIEYANKMATGSTIKNLSLKAMRNLPLHLPTILEQQEIVRILNSMIEKEQEAYQSCEVIDKIDLMKKAILARAFRGELDTNDPNEESAIELLKELLIKEQ